MALPLGAACNSGKKNSPLGVGGKTSYYNHGDCRTFRHRCAVHTKNCAVNSAQN